MQQWKKGILAGLALSLVAMLVLAATSDRYTGPREIWSCTVQVDPAAGLTDHETNCAFDAPQAMTIESAQVHCLTVTGGDGVLFELMEGAAIAGSVVLGTTDDGDPQFMTAGAGTFAIADEAEVNVTFTTAAGESATECQATLVWYRQ